MNKNASKGFMILGLIIAVVIIGILAALYYRRSSNSGPSAHETNQKAIEKAIENNALELQRQIEIQNELNSIGR